ncbi:MAG: condensation domain-containing protein, partial [Daejeonella sp.]|nr:condensation domain-containing protein [Daejeonella sp.]
MSKIADIYPLSHTQQGILYHTVYESDNDLYHNQLSFVVNGNPDLQIFKQAWQEVILRYEVLRTSFHWENMEKPMQVVHHNAAPEWKYDDWSSLNSKQQEAAIINYLQTDKQNRFPLDKPCLMRIATFRISAESLQVVWSFHHLILDGWCLPLLLTEVLENYHAIATDSTISRTV